MKNVNKINFNNNYEESRKYNANNKKLLSLFLKKNILSKCYISLKKIYNI